MHERPRTGMTVQLLARPVGSQLTMANPIETPAPSDETASVASETSAAIVSLYNSWSSSDCGSQFNDDDTLQGDDRFAALPETALSADELLRRLKKRCREDNLPPAPTLRQRKRPVCHFLNYMGATRLTPAPLPRGPPSTIGLELGFDEEKDDLYPLGPKKVKHSTESFFGEGERVIEFESTDCDDIRGLIAGQDS